MKYAKDGIKKKIADLARQAAINSVDFTEVIDDGYLDALSKEDAQATLAFMTFIVESHERMMISVDENRKLAPEAAADPKKLEKMVKAGMMAKIDNTINDLLEIKTALNEHLDRNDIINAMIEESIEPLIEAITQLGERETFATGKNVN